MKKESVIVAVLLLSLVFVGCHPVSNNQYLPLGESDTLSELINATPFSLPQDLQQSETNNSISNKWIGDVSLNNFICKIDAEVHLPNICFFPVWRIEQSNIDQDFIRKFISSYASPIKSIYNTTVKRKDLEEQLEAALRGEVMINENDGTVYYQPFDGQEVMVNDITMQVETYNEQRVSDITLFLNGCLPSLFSIEMQSNKEWFFNCQAQSFIARTYGTNEVLQQESWIKHGGAYPGEKEGATIGDIAISITDAIDTANAVLSDLGICNLSITSVEKARTIHCFSYETTSTGWVIDYCRNDNNSTPVDFHQYSFVEALDFEDDHDSSTWFNERLSMYITSEGLQMIEWDNPITITKELNKNVELLSFDVIKEHIKEIILTGAQWTEKSSFLTVIAISKVYMTYGAIRPNNTDDYRYLLPIWIIEYRYNAVPDEICYFAVNAVDGTRAKPE